MKRKKKKSTSLSADSSRKQERGPNKIRNEGREITTDITEIQRIVRNYYEDCKKLLRRTIC